MPHRPPSRTKEIGRLRFILVVHQCPDGFGVSKSDTILIGFRHTTYVGNPISKTLHTTFTNWYHIIYGHRRLSFYKVPLVALGLAKRCLYKGGKCLAGSTIIWYRKTNFWLFVCIQMSQAGYLIICLVGAGPQVV